MNKLMTTSWVLLGILGGGSVVTCTGPELAGAAPGTGSGPAVQALPQAAPQVQNEPQVQNAPNRQPLEQLQQRVLPGRQFRNRFNIGEELVQGVPETDGAPADAVHEPFVEPITARKVTRAVQDAILFLQSQQRPDGSIGQGHYQQGGETALAVLAMLAAGGDPAADVALQRALDWLLKLEPDNTYVRAIRANVWEYALRKVPYDDRLRKALEQDYRWLLAALGNREGWRYSLTSTDWDNSCTQYGVLGLWAAARAGYDPGDAFWARMSDHFRETQNKDGGWGYVKGSGSSANMATAGLASMFLVFDMYHGRSWYRADQPRTFSSGPAAEVLRAIERGMSWLGESSRGGQQSSYYLYGIERTGVASGRKYIGGLDWFKDGALTVLKAQGPDGSIRLEYGPVISTAFSTLFLVYGGAPVAFQKLEHGADQDWNLNPRDVANLTRHLWSAYERPLNWNSVSIHAPVEELDAPILFLSGSRAIQFDSQQIGKLREYIRRGGIILAEPSDHSPEFRQSVLDLVRQLYPEAEYPGYQLEPLPATHGIFTVLKQDWRALPRLSGVSDGSRTFLLLSEEYLSAEWQKNDVESDAFKLAMNLLFYATDLGVLEGRFASYLPETPAAEPRQQEVRVARVQLVGAGPERDLAAPAWDAAVEYAHHVTGLSVTQLPPVTLGQPAALARIHLLHLTGRSEFRLTEGERTALVSYVKGGGTLLVDAWGGSPAFTAAARRELEGLFGKLRPLEASSPLTTGRFTGGQDLSKNVRFKLPARRHLRSLGQSATALQLEVAEQGGRPAILFSPYDLSAALGQIDLFRSVGYKPESARKIVGNLIGWLGQG